MPGSAGRIEFVAHERVRARDAAAAERARQEVKLEVTKRPGGLTLYVDGPFRCGWIDGHRRGEDCGGRHRQDYLVVYDFEVRVPPRCDLDLSTVLDGDVRVRGIEGAARARAVNGAVHLEQMRGEIDAATVNDDVRVEMAAAPTGSLRLETVNGDAELVTPRLDADIELRDHERRDVVGLPVRRRTRRGGANREARQQECHSNRRWRGDPNRFSGTGRPASSIGDLERRCTDSENEAMKNRIEVLSVAILAIVLCGGPAAAAPSPQRIAVPLSQPGKPARFEVSLIQGGVEVEAYDGKEVVVEARPARANAPNGTTTKNDERDHEHRRGRGAMPARRCRQGRRNAARFPTTASA